MYWSNYFDLNKLKENDTIGILGNGYILKNNILRQDMVYSRFQDQTKNTFGFKWAKRETYESNQVKEKAKNWLYERYLDNESQLLADWIKDGSKVLDAGCGSGFSALLFFENILNKVHYLGVDISNAVEVAKHRFEEKNLPGEFLQADILNLPFSEPIFDVIFSEGVLHHTDSTEKAIKYLSSLLLPGGRFLFYVYIKKAPIREYCDDYIRDFFKDKDDQTTWDGLVALTKLGIALGELNLKINVTEEIPFLEIPAGEIDLQRLFYWYIFKAFYDRNFTLDEMNHVNFDWYRPKNCHRHTPEEIKKFCVEAGLVIERINIQEAGITVVAKKL